MTAPAEIAAAGTSPLVVASSGRAVQVAIAAAAMRDAAQAWPLLDAKRLTQTFPAWLQAMMLITKTYQQRSSQAAVATYQALRTDAVGGASSVVKVAHAPSEEWMREAYGYSGPGLLTRDTVRPNTALTTTMGTTSRIVMDGGRTTTSQTVKADPEAIGWYFLTDATPCFWCALIASRGIVFKKQSLELSNARFVGDGTAKVHNHCHCTLAPAFSHSHPMPSVNDKAQDVYYESTRGVPNKDRLAAFRKGWDAHLAQSA